jgi:hypothetical protein
VSTNETIVTGETGKYQAYQWIRGYRQSSDDRFLVVFPKIDECTFFRELLVKFISRLTCVPM